MGLADPREYGSKNPGATNVLRSGNKAAAILTLAFDALKGYVPVMLASPEGRFALADAQGKIRTGFIYRNIIGTVFALQHQYHTIYDLSFAIFSCCSISYSASKTYFCHIPDQNRNPILVFYDDLFYII